MHVSDAWQATEAITVEAAATYPDAEFTCVRDVFGRTTFLVGGLTDEILTFLQARLDLEDGLNPYLAGLAVRSLEGAGTLHELVVSQRARLGTAGNAFVLERLLTNESWFKQEAAPVGGRPPVIGFYSFKGGVGRSTAAASTSLLLARRGFRVALVDLDLEAPGIESFFEGMIPEGASSGKGVVDYLMERSLLDPDKMPDMGEYVIPVSDSGAEARGGTLLVVPAGDLGDRYISKLGRVNLADATRTAFDGHPLFKLMEALNAWRPLDFIVVDCRTGFTDIGGATLNGLSDLDVLLFKAGATDRRYLPVVLDHVQYLRGTQVDSEAQAEKVARSFLIVYSMVDPPSRPEDATAFMRELRQYTSRVCWEHVFSRFASIGYSYPALDDKDAFFAPVPHDAVLIPYRRELALSGTVPSLNLVEADDADQPHELLVRRILDVKLPRTPPATKPKAEPEAEDERREAFAVLKSLTGKPGAEYDLTSEGDFTERFLPRKAYRALFDPRVFVVLGRKGAGKTALFQLLRHPRILRAFCERAGIDPAVIDGGRWEVGYGAEGDFPDKDLFGDTVRATQADPDLLERLWRALLARRTAQLEGAVLSSFPTWEACAATLMDSRAQDEAKAWLTELNERLEHAGTNLYLAYDYLDVGLSSEPARRAALLSALVTFWQGAGRTWPRIRSKIFLREDLWNREVFATDKAKIRDQVDRGSITWNGIDIYRVVLKRFGAVPVGRAFLKAERLWRPEFDADVDSTLGFVPPEDEDWVTTCVNRIAGETMGRGKLAHKKGYVYSWLLDHSGDAQAAVRPRSMLLLFSGAAKVQDVPQTSGPLFVPASFRTALREEVSPQSVADLKAEYKEEWKAPSGEWIPDTFEAFQRVWPAEEGALEAYLSRLGVPDPKGMMQRMEDAGLFERRQPRGEPVSLQIPDVYLFGLHLTRKGD